MSKATITKVFFGSLVAVVAGLVLTAAGAWLAYLNGTVTTSGSEVTGVAFTAFGWTMVGLAVVGVLVIVGGAIGQFISWIGALLNTSRLEDRAWFIALLLLGIFSFGFIGMLVYVFAGPDGTSATARLHTPIAAEPVA
jgi:hypothetical protein